MFGRIIKTLWKFPTKELSFCPKFQFYSTKISTTKWCIPFIFQTYNVWSTRIHSLKYLRSTIFGYLVSKKLGFKNASLLQRLNSFVSQNSNFLITKYIYIYISLQPDVINFWYFEIILFNLTESIVLNSKGLGYWVAKIKRWANQNLRPNLSSFEQNASVIWYKKQNV